MLFILKHNDINFYLDGEDAFYAVRHNLKFIDKMLVGCTIKHWKIEKLDEKTYSVVIKYYKMQLSRLKRLKKLPPLYVLQMSLVQVD